MKEVALLGLIGLVVAFARLGSSAPGLGSSFGFSPGFVLRMRWMPFESTRYSVMGVLQVTQLFRFTAIAPFGVYAHDSVSLTKMLFRDSRFHSPNSNTSI